MPIGWAITVVVLCAAVVALAVVVLGLLRQLTPVLERAAAAGPDTHNLGPEVGAPLPHFAARGAEGEVTEEHLRGRSSVLLFLTGGCGACQTLAEEMNRADLGGLTGQLLVVTGAADLAKLGIPAVLSTLIEEDRAVSDPLSVVATPLAVAVDPDGIVQAVRIPNTLEQLDDIAAVVA
jgi:hypothetical protein